MVYSVTVKEVPTEDIKRRANIEIHQLLGGVIDTVENSYEPHGQREHPEVTMIRNEVLRTLRNFRKLIEVEPYIDIKPEEKENNDN